MNIPKTNGISLKKKVKKIEDHAALQGQWVLNLSIGVAPRKQEKKTGNSRLKK